MEIQQKDMFYTLLGQPVTSVAMSRFGQIKSAAHPALLGSSPFYRKMEGYTGSFLFIFFCISQTSLNKIFNQKHQSCVCLIFCVLLLHHNNECFQHIQVLKKFVNVQTFSRNLDFLMTKIVADDVRNEESQIKENVFLEYSCNSLLWLNKSSYECSAISKNIKCSYHLYNCTFQY